MRMSVRPFILSNIYPSMATRTVAINFYLKHQWGGEKIVLLLLLLFLLLLSLSCWIRTHWSPWQQIASTDLHWET